MSDPAHSKHPAFLVLETSSPEDRRAFDEARAEGGQDRARHMYRPHPDDENELAAALNEVAQGQTVDLTTDELAAWEATGDFPASVEARFAGCHG